MSTVHERKVRKMFGALGQPPAPQAARGTLDSEPKQRREKSDRIEQLNARVPAGYKKKVRLLATRDGISLSEVIVRAVALYEEKHGKAPEL